MTSRRLLSPVAKILLEAADYIEANGHYQGAAYKDAGDPHSPACALGALVRVSTLEGITRIVAASQYELAKQALEVHIAGVSSGHPYGNQLIPVWNDDPERTREDVIAALRAAAIATQGST